MYVLAMLARLVFVPHLNKYYAYNVMIIKLFSVRHV